jgi:hypothetical protein
MGLRAQLRAEDSRHFGARVADARLDGVMLRLRGGEGAAGIFAASVSRWQHDGDNIVHYAAYGCHVQFLRLHINKEEHHAFKTGSARPSHTPLLLTDVDK